jgi:amino acid permease
MMDIFYIILIFYFFSVISLNAVVKNKKPDNVKKNQKESQLLRDG